jgi:hypothetical protein
MTDVHITRESGGGGGASASGGSDASSLAVFALTWPTLLGGFLDPSAGGHWEVEAG